MVPCTHSCHLTVYSLADSKLLYHVGKRGVGRGQFAFSHGSVCFTPAGTLLVAENVNGRVQVCL